jgi:hypothetical protein
MMKYFFRSFKNNILARSVILSMPIIGITRIVFVILSVSIYAIAFRNASHLFLSFIPIVLGMIWIIGIMLDQLWFANVIFFAFIVCTCMGFIFQANQMDMIIGFLSSLIVWDLDHYISILRSVSWIENRNALVFRHLKSLMVTITSSVFLLILSKMIQISLHLVVAVALAAGAILSIRWLSSSIPGHIKE